MAFLKIPHGLTVDHVTDGTSPPSVTGVFVDQAVLSKEFQRTFDRADRPAGVPGDPRN